MATPPSDLRLLAPREFLSGTGDGTALENLITEQIPDGAFCYVLDELNFYVYDNQSMAAVSPPTVIATGRGSTVPGRWYRYDGATGPGVLNFPTNAALRLESPPVNGQLISIESPLRIWKYNATLGAGMADDDLTIIKPASVLIGSPGRYSPAEGRAVAPTFASVRLAISGSAQVLKVLGKATFHDGFQGEFDRRPVAGYVDDDTNVLVAGAYAYVRRGTIGYGALPYATNTALRADVPLLDGQLATVLDPLRVWRYVSALGAGMADDDLTIIKPASVLIGNPGRYSPAEGAAVAGTFAQVRLAISGSALVLVVLGKTTFHDGFQGEFDRRPVAGYVDDDTDVLVAGAYAYVRRGSTPPMVHALAAIGTGAAFITLLTVPGPVSNGDMMTIIYEVFGRFGATASLLQREALLVQRLGGVTTILSNVATFGNVRVQAVVSAANILIQAQQDVTNNWSFSAKAASQVSL